MNHLWHLLLQTYYTLSFIQFIVIKCYRCPSTMMEGIDINPRCELLTEDDSKLFQRVDDIKLLFSHVRSNVYSCFVSYSKSIDKRVKETFL